MLSRSTTVRLAALTLLLGLTAPAYADGTAGTQDPPITVGNLEIQVWADLAKPINGSTHAHLSNVDVEAGSETKVRFWNRGTVNDRWSVKYSMRLEQGEAVVLKELQQVGAPGWLVINLDPDKTFIRAGLPGLKTSVTARWDGPTVFYCDVEAWCSLSPLDVARAEHEHSIIVPVP